ncbi:MAG: hypothetical protein NT062_24005, partial [Proteobacteria bacterium]|nr:hypothetical protein [Pseudomonadota bacterium]
ALAVGAAGIGLAWMFYGRGPTPTIERLVAGPLQGAYQASKNKLWVDEIYDAVIVKPFKTLARGLFEIVDRFIIDTVAVNGLAFVVGLFGRLARWFQNGSVQRYLAGLVVGAALVFFVTNSHRSASFDFKIVGDQLELHALPGGGIITSTSILEWDINGDGKPDVHPQTGKPLTGADVTIKYGDVRTANVTLIITDPISRDRETVVRTIIAPDPSPTPTQENK